MIFEEKMRVFLTGDLTVNRVNKWIIDSDSQMLIKFLQPLDDESGKDDNGTVYIQALRRRGKATVRCSFGNGGEESCQVLVMIDQVEYETNYLEAPYVGYSLSTPQLYVTTNIGYQVVRNSFPQPDELRGSEVCAVLQNSFSAGMYLNGSGDFPMIVNQFNLSNIYFQLVDSNYHPVKLFSPMFVIMKIEYTADPVQDIKALAPKLPKNAPTPQQVQTQQAQAKAQKEEAEKKQVVVDALAQAVTNVIQLPPTQLPPPQAPNLNQVASVEPNLVASGLARLEQGLKEEGVISDSSSSDDDEQREREEKREESFFEKFVRGISGGKKGG
jgi:hypothetical protein